MIIIGESGSTKCDWIVIDNHTGEEVDAFTTMGFNPYFHSSAFVNDEMQKNDVAVEWQQLITKVFFYGAGCSTDALKATIRKGLSRFFSKAVVSVDHDLNAAAYAAYDNEPEVVCILGTGSNSCFFDGEIVSEEVPALAYVLGDEGSASYLGKRLLAAFLYKKLPTELHEDFVETYQIEKDDIITSVYNRPHANVYLASFSRFVGKHASHPYFRKMVKEGFEHFTDIHICCFKEAVERNVKINFIGSVAFHFQDILKEVLAEKSLLFGRVIAKPAQALVNYHIEHLKVLDEVKSKSI
ncbi:MAG: ATPase [Schleiferiaceae bacterium]|nr:ATPase [Schleiferiaceae bacterium]